MDNDNIFKALTISVLEILSIIHYSLSIFYCEKLVAKVNERLNLDVF